MTARSRPYGISTSRPRELWPSVAGVAIPPLVVDAGREAFRRYGTLTSPLRPLPEFLVIGAKRSGTTSLFFDVLRHPGVLPLFPSARLLPKRRDGKGPHFFDSEYSRGLAWYRAHFPSRFERARVSRRVGPVVTGEASPYSLYHPLAPVRAARHVPGLKLIALLRDPVERTYSHYKEQRRNGVETLTFEQALEAEPARTAGEEERLLADEDYRSFPHEQQSYVRQSEYDRGLARWLEHFPREQLLVLASEDYYADPGGVCQQVFAFLGLGPLSLPPSAVLNAAPGSSMAAETRRRLTEHFAPHVREVERLTGQSFPWSRP
jgi:hypothetical protein